MCGYGTALNEISGVCEIACPASRRMLDAQAVGEAEEEGVDASRDAQAEAVDNAVADTGVKVAVTAGEMTALLQAASAEPSAAMAALARVLQDPQNGPEQLAAAITTMDDTMRSALADSLFRRPSLA